MKELYRVLKPGAWAILQVPIHKTNQVTDEDFTLDAAQRTERYGQADHVRFYGQDYADRLRSAGFRVTVDHYANSITEEERAYFGLMAGESIYYCEKPDLVGGTQTESVSLSAEK